MKICKIWMQTMGCLLVMLLTDVVNAGAVRLTTEDGYNHTAFTSADHWTPQIAPNSEAGRACDYVVDNGKKLRTPQTDSNAEICRWQGLSLTIGDSDIGILLFKSYTPSAKVYVDGLTLKNGRFEVGDAGKMAYLSGAASVLASRDAPFGVAQYNADARYITIESSLSGDKSSGLSFFATQDAGKLQVSLRGDNTSYFGNFKVGKNTELVLGSKSAMGGIPDSFDDEKFVLDGCTVTFPASPVVLDAAERQGIAVNGAGAVLNNSSALLLRWPVKGSGELIKKGSGTMTVGSASWEPTRLIVEAGAVGFEESFVAPAGFKVVYASDPVVSVAGDGSSPTVNFAGDTEFASARPLFIINLMSMPTLSAGQESRVAVMTLPRSTYELHSSDFDLTGAWSPEYTKVGAVRIETDGNGLQTVYLYFSSSIKNSSNDAPNVSYKTFVHGECWEDGNPVDEGHHYVYLSNELRISTSGNITEDWRFPGRSLTFGGSGSCMFISKARTAHFGDLRIYNAATVTFGSLSSGGNQTISGDIYLCTTTEKPLSFNNGYNRIGINTASLHGVGCVRYSTSEKTSPETPVVYRATGDNSDYLGLTIVASQNSSCSKTVLEISDETNVGGNPRAFEQGALTVGTCGILRITGNAVFDDVNRGVSLLDGSGVDVLENKTLTIKTPTSVSGTVRKEGLGLLCMMADGLAESGARVEIAAGALQVNASRAFGGGAVTFADAVCYRVDATVSNELGLYSAVGIEAANSIEVEVYGDETLMTEKSFLVPLFTVPSEAASELARKIRIRKGPRYVTHAVSRTVTIGEEITVDGIACRTLFVPITPKNGVILVVR